MFNFFSNFKYNNLSVRQWPCVSWMAKLFKQSIAVVLLLCLQILKHENDLTDLISFLKEYVTVCVFYITPGHITMRSLKDKKDNLRNKTWLWSITTMSIITNEYHYTLSRSNLIRLQVPELSGPSRDFWNFLHFLFKKLGRMSVEWIWKEKNSS